jgi:c-di-GMP-binding flagellar brake protein YcgR
MKKKEERLAERVPLEHTFVHVHTEKVQEQKELRGDIYDISTVGIRFVSKKPFTIGSKIYLSLLLPNGTSLSDIACEVLRSEKKNGNYYIAIAFTDLDFYQKSMVKDYIRLMKLRSDF